MAQLLGSSIAIYFGFGLVSEWFGLKAVIILAIAVGLLELICYLSVKKV